MASVVTTKWTLPEAQRAVQILHYASAQAVKAIRDRENTTVEERQHANRIHHDADRLAALIEEK